MQIRKFILLFGLVNAALYASLLPLWEGFDEAFHYSYVETLWQTRHLPVLGRTTVMHDVAESFRLTPVSHIVHRWFPDTTSYDTWFSLPGTEKVRRRTELGLLHPEPRNSSRPNYEAFQPPLAYVLLSLVDWPAASGPITVRVLVLRLFAGVFCILLIYWGATSLCRTLLIPDSFANAALFTIFCSQMLYATAAHVANDWLAVGLSALFLAALAEFVRRPDRRSGVSAGLWLAAGLLTKAYFLAFGLMAFAVAAIMIWRRRERFRAVLPAAIVVLVLAGPWYARNLVLYGNVSGTHEEFDGIGVRQALAVAPRIDWVATAGFLARGSLWTGNGSFTTFSRTTLNIELFLLFCAVAAWGVRRRSARAPELMVAAAVVLFSAAIAYATCANVAHSNEDVPGASPWYSQVLLVPVVALAYLGMSRWERFGAVLAALTTTIWAWVLIATWTIKLFPLYSGAGGAPMRFADVWNWYTHNAGAHVFDLSLVALAPVPLLWGLLLLSLVLTVLLSGRIILELISWSRRPVFAARNPAA